MHISLKLTWKYSNCKSYDILVHSFLRIPQNFGLIKHYWHSKLYILKKSQHEKVIFTIFAILCEEEKCEENRAFFRNKYLENNLSDIL